MQIEFSKKHFVYGAFALLSLVSLPAASAYEWNGMDIKPRGSVSGTYDDNVTFVENNEIDDFITRVSAGLEARAEGKTRKLDVIGNLNHEFFWENDEFDNTSGDLSVDFKQEITEHDRFRIRDYFLRAEEARTFEEAFTRTQGRYEYWRNRFLFDYMHDFTRQWSLTGRFGQEVSDFSRAGVDDSTLWTGGAEASYQHTSTLKFLFAYDYEIRDFENGGDSDTHTLSTGALYYITKQVYIEGRVGVDFIEGFAGESYEKPLFRVRLTDEINEITSWDIAFEKEFSPTSYTQDIFDYWQVSTSLRRQMSERMNAYLSAFFGEGDYMASNREDRLWGANASLAYDLTKNWKGTLKYTYTDVSSTLNSQEYSRNTVQVGLALTF